MERLLAIFALLSDSWWWDMDIAAWEQVFMLCSAILGGVDRKGKGRDRDEETKLAAVSCLWTLLRQRTHAEDPAKEGGGNRVDRIFANLKQHVQTPKFLPVMGQTLHSLMITAESTNLSLQRMSLNVLSSIIGAYLPDGFVPSVLPGTVSSMSKVALGEKSSKGWANGDVVAGALLVIQHAIVRALGDEVCIRDGVVRGLDSLEDLTLGPGDREQPLQATPLPPYSTLRTEQWLRGTASQLHIALNGLSPLVKHQTPSALVSLATFSATVLSETTLTLPQSQPLLISYLLSLKSSPFHRVATEAEQSLRKILSPSSKARHQILGVLLQISRDYLTALPRLLLARADSKIEHAAGVLESICHLAEPPDRSSSLGVVAISAGVGKLLGPHGGIEKWGWSLLFTLEFANPSVVITPDSAAQLMLEHQSATLNAVPFPELVFRRVNSRSARDALARMFRAMGKTAGEECLFAVDWFVNAGRAGRGKRAVAALWCACRLLEGAGSVSLEPGVISTVPVRRSKRLEKFARDLARQVADDWDEWDEDDQDAQPDVQFNEETTIVEHVQSQVTLPGITGPEPSMSSTSAQVVIQPILHRSLSLQMLAITARILESRFPTLFLHVLYPILHGIVSVDSTVSASALAALDNITDSTSYATPGNLLLSNFDYALDSVSRHLTRRWLDVDATKVLAVLVRLVGRDVVQKAGDVVEECFDRLDEYHGYELIVDGLVEVLGEVVKAIEEDEDNRLPRISRNALQDPTPLSHSESLDSFATWFVHRHDKEPPMEPLRDDSYPRKAWATDEEAETDTAPPVQEEDPFAETPPTPSQTLTTQIVSRSMYFLTHASPVIRARILLLLARAVPVLPEAALLPSVNKAWPFILNRLADSETFVVSAAVALVEALARHVGDFMTGRVWEDVWPRFRRMLVQLDRADAASALARRTPGVSGGGVGTASAYTHSHRLYRAIIVTMTTAVRGVQAQDTACWEVVVLFRRFLRCEAHEELQARARELYTALSENNEDAVWLGLAATVGWVEGSVAFLREPKWDVETNVRAVLKC